jgi:DNA-binding XRE family transcriptional regulator
MADFQKQLRRLRGKPTFAAAFDKKRAEAEVAFQIRRLRESKGWSQKDLAKKASCSQQAISAVEQAGYSYYAVSPKSSMRMLSSRSFLEKLHDPIKVWLLPYSLLQNLVFRQIHPVRGLRFRMLLCRTFRKWQFVWAW